MFKPLVSDIVTVVVGVTQYEVRLAGNNEVHDEVAGQVIVYWSCFACSSLVWRGSLLLGA